MGPSQNVPPPKQTCLVTLPCSLRGIASGCYVDIAGEIGLAVCDWSGFVCFVVVVVEWSTAFQCLEMSLISNVPNK